MMADRRGARGVLAVATAIAGAGLLFFASLPAALGYDATAMPTDAYRYSAAYLCDRNPAPNEIDDGVRAETSLAIANPTADAIGIEIALASEGGANTEMRSIGAWGQLVLDCESIEALTTADGASFGFLVLESDEPLDVVASYTTTVEPRRFGSLVTAADAVLASVTFEVQLEKHVDETTAAALAELGIMLGKPVMLMTLSDAEPGEVVEPREVARKALVVALAEKLELQGTPSASARTAAEEMVADHLLIWVMVEDTDIALSDRTVTTQVVPIAASAQPASTPVVGSGPTPTPTPTPVANPVPPPITPGTPPITPGTVVSAPTPTPVTVTVIHEGQLSTWWLWWLPALAVLGSLLTALCLWWLFRRFLRREKFGPPGECGPPGGSPPPGSDPPGSDPPGGSPPPGVLPPPVERAALYRFACALAGEKELDVDDREADLIIEVVLLATSDLRVVRDATLTLDFDFAGQQTSMQGMDSGQIELEIGDLLPGIPVRRTVPVSTGAFSDPTLTRPSSEPGARTFAAHISGMPEPPFEGGGAASGTGTLRFVVAED